MYVLIADSGSTKTDWVLLKDSEIIIKSNTIGFNPYFQSLEEINKELTENLKPNLANYLSDIEAVYYYGAGCSSIENCKIIENCLITSLNCSTQKINVSHDLLAAARALCGNNEGIACILGTGSNSCLYNGSLIVENIPSVGYLWGDYGSGAYLGKFFIQNYFDNKLPFELKEAFELEGYNREVILTNTYRKSMPSKYLAGVSKFIGKHKKHPFINDFLEDCFDSFFLNMVNIYSNSKSYNVHAVGSIGYFYKDYFEKAALKNGYKVGNIIQSPMEGLIKYHHT